MVSDTGEHLSGARPSKEAFLHLAMYRARPQDHATVQLHSTYATALSCLDDLDDDDVLPPLTAYFVMKVGRLVRLPYFAPGDQGLAETAQKVAASSRALLLGPPGCWRTLPPKTAVRQRIRWCAGAGRGRRYGCRC